MNVFIDFLTRLEAAGLNITTDKQLLGFGLGFTLLTLILCYTVVGSEGQDTGFIEKTIVALMAGMYVFERLLGGLS